MENKLNDARIYEIDGLRGLAILSIIFLHWVIQPLSFLFSKSVNETLSLFAYGVDLFFVISGFLIGGILLRIGKNVSGAKSFYIRRILRIWPLYYLLLFLSYLFAQNHDIFFDIPYWTFFIFIFNFWESAKMPLHQVLGPLWSIAIEEQFYIAAPLLFLTLSRKRLTSLIITYLALAPFGRLWLLTNTDLDVWRFTFVRLDGIGAGVLLAILFSSTDFVDFLLPRIKSLQLLTLLLFVSSFLLKVTASKVIWFSFGNSLTAFAFAFLLATVQCKRLLHQKIQILNPAFLRYLGMRCYFIYLFHVFFMLIARAVTKDFFIGLALQSSLTLFFAHLSWKYLEAPLIIVGKKFRY